MKNSSHISRYQHVRKRQKLLAFFRLVRLPNLVMIALCQVLVALKLVATPWPQTGVSAFQLFVLVLATTASAAGGYIINDYYDIKIDILNKPGRVVVGKLISRRRSMIAHLLLAGFAIVLSGVLSMQIMIVTTFCSGWLWLYSNRLKRLPGIGNITIAILTTVAIYLPVLIFPPAKQELYIFCLFAFWLSLIREIIKDLEDMRGDARHGCRTLPILFGLRTTKNLIYVLVGLFILNAIFALNVLHFHWFIPGFVLSICLALIVVKLLKADKTADFTQLSLWCKWLMLGGTLSILFV